MAARQSAAAVGSGPGLGDLPDDILAIIARKLFATRVHGGFFGACRRFCTVGHCAIRVVTLRSRTERDEDRALEDQQHSNIPDSILARDWSLTASGLVVQRQLRSVFGFLGRAHGLREVILHPYHEGGDGDVFSSECDHPPPVYAGAPSVDALFYALLLPELRRLPLTALTASGVSVSALRDPPLSAAPLRRLELRKVEATMGVGPLLACHGHSLTALHLEDYKQHLDYGLSEVDIGGWIDASGGMPLLQELEVDLSRFDAVAAAAVARACPALAVLRVEAMVRTGVGVALGLPAALPRLTHLRWHVGYAEEEEKEVIATELSRLLLGRALTRLEFANQCWARLPSVVVLRTLRACAALPETLDVMDMKDDLDDSLLAQLVTATDNLSLVALQTPLAPTVTIAGLGHLQQLPALSRLTVTIRQADVLASGIDQWLLHRLTHLSFHRYAGGRGMELGLLRGLAASGCQANLVRLRMTGEELTEAEADPPLAALVRLRFFEYNVGCTNGPGDRLSDAAINDAVARMRSWLHRRLPALNATIAGMPASWVPSLGVEGPG